VIFILVFSEVHKDIYYAMKISNGYPQELKNYIINVLDHYQVDLILCTF